MKFTIPDKQFTVAVASWSDPRGRVIGHIFASITDKLPTHLAKWRKVPEVTVFLVGDCDQAVKSLLKKYNNQELAEMLDFNPTKAAALAKFLKLDRYSDVKRGGKQAFWNR